MRTKYAGRYRRQRRVRKKVAGTTARPRLNIFRSARHMYAQVIDDEHGKTIVAASTLSEEIKSDGKSTGNIDAAKKVGALIAKKALAAGITEVVFDRAGFLYHGRVKSLAEGAREAGLKF